MKPFIKGLKRSVSEEDIIRLTEIKIKRISKYNKFKADELLIAIEDELKEVEHHLANLIEYCINYYSRLLEKYGKGRERKTELQTFDTINAANVVINNAKLYVNRADGFMGYGLKKTSLYVSASDLDDVIVFHKDGSYQVTRIAEKVFIGKNPIHVAVWKKGDKRMTYNMIYADLSKSTNYAKRFHVSSITRDKRYPVAGKIEKAKLLHFSANPNGEAEIVGVQLSQSCTAKKKEFEFDFSSLAIKGRSSTGNIVTKYPVRRIKQISQGVSTLGAIKIWYDENAGRLNTDGYGTFVDAFEEDDKILALYDDGNYELTNYDTANRYDAKKLVDIVKWTADRVVSVIYTDGIRKQHL